MNNNIKHFYYFNILKNVKDSIFRTRLIKFFDKKNAFTRNILFLEKNKEMKVHYLNHIFQKNKNKFRNFRNFRKSARKMNKTNFISLIKKMKIIHFIGNLILKKIDVIENKISLKIINAQIIAKIIANTLKKNRFRKIKNKIKKYFRFSENNVWNTQVTAIKICIHGRLNRDRIVPRKTKSSFIKGRFKGCNFIDKGYVTIKNRKGHYKIRVYIGII